MELSGQDPVTDVSLFKDKVNNSLDQLSRSLAILKKRKAVELTHPGIESPLYWADIDVITPKLTSTIRDMWEASERLSNEITQTHYGEKIHRSIWESRLQKAVSSYSGTKDDNRRLSTSTHGVSTTPLPHTAQSTQHSYSAIPSVQRPYSSVPRLDLSTANRDMEEHQRISKSGSTFSGLGDLYHTENQLDAVRSNLQAPVITLPLSTTFQESFPSPTASPSERTPTANEVRKRGDPHICNFCFKTFTRGTTLREHARTHTDERPYKCCSCERAFSRLKDCRRHERLHANAITAHCGGGSYGVLWGCGRKFTRPDALKAHLSSSQGVGCLNPLLEDRKDRILRAAFRNIAFCEGPMEGDMWGCGRQLETLDALKAHLEAQNKQCFKSRAHLDKEQLDCLIIELGRFPYACPRTYGGCGKRFESAIDLKVHVDVPCQSHCLRLGIIFKAMKTQDWKRSKE